MQNDEEIIKKYADMVYRMAFAHVRSHSDADDIFQEVFLRYVKKHPQFENEEHEKRWFLKVTANCAKSYLTSAWMRYFVPLEEEIFQEPEENRLSEALLQLPPKYRDVVHLHYYEGYKTEEIAEILRRKPDTIRKQLSRARDMLKKILEEEFL
ncbi:MAG: RNA polymerase sigma factor [Oscillospiraceae bacterium]